jgi:type II secretory pathway component PulJ
MQFVYDTLDPEIADYLRENNPNPKGTKHHHQKFNEVGYKLLTDHLLSVMGIIKASPNMDRFKESLAFAFPHKRTQQRARQAKNRLKQTSLSLTYAPMSGTITQLSLFDGIEENLSLFDQSLKTALDYNPKGDE